MAMILNEMQHSFYSAEAELSLRDHFELRMLEENRIPGLLTLSVCDDNGKLRLNYDITGLNPLSEEMLHRKLQADQLRLLLLSLKHTISGLAPYLLRAEGILLTADAVYLTPQSGAPVFLYQPGRLAPFSESLTRFLEILLSGTDHDDYNSILLAYRLYKESEDHPNALDHLEQILISQSLPDDTANYFRQNPKDLPKDLSDPQRGELGDPVYEAETIREVLTDEPLCIRDADNQKNSGILRRLFPK